MRQEARLINRGEQFEYLENDRRYAGQCVWEWEGSRRSYPITLLANSIGRKGIGLFLPMTKRRKNKIADRVKHLLEDQIQGAQVRIWWES